MSLSLCLYSVFLGTSWETSVSSPPEMCGWIQQWIISVVAFLCRDFSQPCSTSLRVNSFIQCVFPWSRPCCYFFLHSLFLPSIVFRFGLCSRDFGNIIMVFIWHFSYFFTATTHSYKLCFRAVLAEFRGMWKGAPLNFVGGGFLLFCVISEFPLGGCLSFLFHCSLVRYKESSY